MPTNFKVTYDMKIDGNVDYSSVYIEMGTAKGNSVLIGKNRVNWVVLTLPNGTQLYTSNYDNAPSNTYFPVEMKYENGVISSTYNNNKTFSYSYTHTARDYIGYRIEKKAYVKNIIIMPL